MDAKTRVSLDRMEGAGYLPALRGIAQSASAPFWWHGLDKEGKYRIHHNGTICFVQTPKRLIAVTAWHVFNEYRAAKAQQPNIRCQFGSTTTEPEARLIAESEYLDLATFDVSEVVVAAAGGSPYAPLIWPTREVSGGEALLYGGYPGSLRVEHEATADLPFQWFAGAPISVTPENIKLHIDLENFHQPLSGNIIPNVDLGGMSGGPVFRLVPAPPIERLELVGFIYESQPSLSLLYARPSHYITEQGLIDRHAA
jgi:hypothetical protein